MATSWPPGSLGEALDELDAKLIEAAKDPRMEEHARGLRRELAASRERTIAAIVPALAPILSPETAALMARVERERTK